METIRQRLTKQARTVFITVAASIVLGVALAFLGGPFEKVVIYLVVAGMLVAVIYANVAIKCPKCGKSLVLMLSLGTALPSLQRKSERENFCPHCGTNFDERV